MNRYRSVSLVAVLGVSAGGLAQVSVPTDLGLLPGNTAIGPATNSQLHVSVARGGDQFLVAWSDFRARSAGSQSVQSDGDVFGIRLDASGAPIDAAPFLIAGGMGLQQRPTAAWNGSNWLVIYESQDPTEGYYDTFVRAVRVSAGGAVLDAQPLALPANTFSPSNIGLTVSGAGGQWLVARCVYHADGYGTYLAGQRIADDGHLVDAVPVMLNDWVYGPLKVFPSGNEYMVVGPSWNDGGTLKGRRISATTLQPLAGSFDLPPGVMMISSGTMGIGGSDTGEFYVTWIANFTDLVGSRMSATGALLNPAGTMLFPNFAGSLSIAHDGTQWWIARSVSDDANLIRISSAGARLDPIGGVRLPITITGNVTSLYDTQVVARPAAGQASGGVLFAWSDLRETLGNDSNGFVLPVSAANVPGDERCVTTSTPNQRNAHLSAGPAGAGAVAFVSELAADDRVMVQMLDRTGAAASSEPIEVGRAPTIGTCGIAWNGTNYMVTWDQGYPGSSPLGIVARTVSADGTLLGDLTTIMPGQAPSIGALGNDFLIAGTRYGTYPQYIYLYGNRIDGATGQPLDGPSGVYLGGNYMNGLTRVRTDGARWYVATHTQWTHNSSQGDAVLAIVPPVGVPTEAFNPTPFSGGSGDLDVAFSGTNSLLVWRNNSLSNANNYVAGRLMNTDGTYGPMFTIVEAAGRQLRPTVTWDGSTYLVALEDQRNQGSFFDARTDVYGVRVTRDGTVQGAAFPIVRTTDGDCAPSVLTVDGMTLVATARFVTGGGMDSYRIGLTRIGEPASGCAADFNRDGEINPDDLGDYINCYFAPVPCGAADVNADGEVNPDDLGDYINMYFVGC